MTQGMKIFVTALCIYFIIGAWRYRTMDQRLLDQWDEEAVRSYRANRKFSQAHLPAKRVREAMFFLYVLFFWFNTIGMKPLPNKEKDNGDS